MLVTGPGREPLLLHVGFVVTVGLVVSGPRAIEQATLVKLHRAWCASPVSTPPPQ